MCLVVAWTLWKLVCAFAAEIEEEGLKHSLVRLYAQPTVILISSRVDESVDAILDPRKSSEDAALDEQGP